MQEKHLALLDEIKTTLAEMEDPVVIASFMTELTVILQSFTAAYTEARGLRVTYVQAQPKSMGKIH